MKNFLKSIVDKLLVYLTHHSFNKSLITLQSLEYARLRQDMREKTPLNTALWGRKVYSQNDEDGVIQRIFSQIDHSATFIEIGIQDGRECNSLALLLQGWKGVWVEGDTRNCQAIKNDLGADYFPARFRVLNKFIVKENICEIVNDSRQFLGIDEVDFFSIDIDGNDYHIVETMLAGNIRPKVFCIEYNGKFPPPMKVGIRYNAKHVWDKSEYQGASIQLFHDLFKMYGYSLLCCNLTGINAFFVLDRYMEKFERYSIEDLFQECRYNLSPIIQGAPPSLRFLKEALTADE